LETANDWLLERSDAGDIDRLMNWFPDAAATTVWGGPNFRFPFTRHSFAEDMHWGRMASFSLRDSLGELAAFGQLYEKYSCINLARLVVNPTMRGQGLGRRLVSSLMQVGRPMFPCAKFSLFVYRDNKPAYQCYKSLGFITTQYPEDMPMADLCYYLTRPVDDSENHNAP
jgi:ribosomal protein S18 acetylase RimI-like enzyme